MLGVSGPVIANGSHNPSPQAEAPPQSTGSVVLTPTLQGGLGTGGSQQAGTKYLLQFLGAAKGLCSVLGYSKPVRSQQGNRHTVPRHPLCCFALFRFPGSSLILFLRKTS